MKSYSSNFQQLDQLTREVKLIDADMKRVMVSDIQSLLVNGPMSICCKPWLDDAYVWASGEWKYNRPFPNYLLPLIGANPLKRKCDFIHMQIKLVTFLKEIVVHQASLS